VVFRATFDCLWCGTPHEVRAADDLEGYAQLCPSCIGKAGENGFLRFRLKEALAERSAHAPAASVAVAEPAPAEPPVEDLTEEMKAYYAARASEYDDWYLRTGRYQRGPVHDMAWNVDLDTATMWLDALPIHGEIVELAAGTGWWSALLADKGVLSIYDANELPLDRARDRLLAHGLRAHIHVRDAWAEPDRQVDALYCGFWLSHVPRHRLAEFVGLARRWLKPGGIFAFIDSRPDPQSGTVDQKVSEEVEVSARRVSDGRVFRVVKVYWQPDELEEVLLAAGFAAAEVTTTSRFFLLGRATA
jgi:SAM-dependent methyltransferase